MNLRDDCRKMRHGALLMLSVLLSLAHCMSVGAVESVNAPRAKGQLAHKVYAHYLCCFDDLGTSEFNPYWWGTTCNPWDQNQTSGAVLLEDSKAADKRLQGMIDDMKIAKSYGVDGFFVE